MYGNEAHVIKTIPVQPGALVLGNLSENGALRFEHSGRAMMGKPELRMTDGALQLHYDDGTTVNVQV